MPRLGSSTFSTALFVALTAFTGDLSAATDVSATAVAGVAKTSQPIELLLPASAYSITADRVLAAQVEVFNRQNSDTPVKIIRRGEDFSSLRELTARKLAGSVPDIAGIDPAELPAVEKLGILRPFPGTGRLSRPFQRAIPLLIANVKRLPQPRLPVDWDSLLKLVHDLSHLSETSAEPSEPGFVLAIPLQGARGLWIFEALVHPPLWKRSPGGVQANREIRGPLAQVRQLLEGPGLARPDESWEHALQAFLDRKVPLLVATSDLLPLIAGRASFPWKAGLLPVPPRREEPSKVSRLEAGTDLVITRDTPGVRKFLNFLDSPESSARWARAGGWLPVKADWTASRAWREPPSDFYRDLQALLSAAGKGKARTSERAADAEIVRIRSEWIQSLRLLVGGAPPRPELEEVLTQIDAKLGARSASY